MATHLLHVVMETSMKVANACHCAHAAVTLGEQLPQIAHGQISLATLTSTYVLIDAGFKIFRWGRARMAEVGSTKASEPGAEKGEAGSEEPVDLDGRAGGEDAAPPS